MRWSVRLCRVAGIGIYIHFTFLLLLLWVAFTQRVETQSWPQMWGAVGFILILFGIVVLHELAHALTARRFGIHTREITLLPIGGVARLERMPEEPRQELLVALAGPAVNVCLALLCFAVIGADQQLAAFANWHSLTGDFLPSLMWANVFIAGFNLLPAFPMDGGRVLRALLAMRLSYVRATTLAASLGQAMALVFGFAGLASIFFGRFGPLSHPFLILVGLFVWVGAAQESGMVRMRSNLGGLDVSRLLIPEFRSLSPEDPLRVGLHWFLRGWQKDFPVTQGGRLVGLLRGSALVHGVAQLGPDALIADVMVRRVPTIELHEAAETALCRLRSGETSTLIAVEGDRVCGLVTREKLGDFLLVQAAVQRSPATAPPLWQERPEQPAFGGLVPPPAN